MQSSAALRYRQQALSRVQTMEPIRDTDSTPSMEKGEKPDHSHNEMLVDMVGRPDQFPNRWAKIRNDYKEPFAEFWGTCILILFGNGVNCQVVLSKLTQGSYLSISHGWGIGVMCGVYAAGGVSGAHMSP
jgi:hypothetical protein